MVLLAKKEGGEPIVLCDKIAQQIPPLEDGRHGVCETTERQPGPLNKKGVQASKERKREHKRVLDRFAHRPFQPITCPSLTILEITSLRDVLCVIRAKSDACVAPSRGRLLPILCAHIWPTPDRLHHRFSWVALSKQPATRVFNPNVLKYETL